MRLLFLTVLLLALTVGVVVWMGQAEEPVRATLAVADALGRDTTGYRRADAPRTFVFPEDHGPHPGFKTEWWYLTGHAATPTGRRFGYQFTLFRVGLAPPDAAARPRASDWAADHLYMGHFTVTDVAEAGFHVFERFSREALGLAGAQAEPLRVWLEDWTLEAAPGGLPAMHVRAAQEDVAVDLLLRPLKPVVLQGEEGLDRKGAEPGNASYYYSITRLATEGTVTVDGETHPVEGLSWLDREWSTSALGEGQEGWDWFSLQLDDGRDLMYYQLRERDGSASPFTSGVLVAEDGTPRHLGAEDVRLEVLDRWESPRTGAVYPARWRLRIPSEGLDLVVAPVVPDQELDVTVRYWEGAVEVEGTSPGHGYVELTGY